MLLEYFEEQMQVLNTTEVTWLQNRCHSFSWIISLNQNREKNLHMPLLHYHTHTKRHKMAFSIHNKVAAWSDVIRLPSYYVKSN